jgi:hypothetical protein
MIISAAPVLKNELTALIGPTSCPVSPDRPKIFTARSVSSMRLEMLGTAALVRDMVPVQRVYDGKCGLLDNVATNFYGYYGDRADFTAHFSSGMLIIVR